MSKGHRPQLPLAAAAEVMLRKRFDGNVVTAYALGRHVSAMIRDGLIDGRQLRIEPRNPRRADFSAIREALLNKQLLVYENSLPSSIFFRVSKEKTEPAEVICASDPFGFLSHLSAMAIHGLTNRIPQVLFFTTLRPKEWRQSAYKRMHQDLGGNYASYVEEGLPSLSRPRISRIRGTSVKHIFTKQTLGAFRHLEDRRIRVSTLGRTFLEMLQRPEHAGGISHVVEVFEEYAREYLPLILNEFDVHGTKIDRVRAGYLLEERCGIKSHRLESWTKDAQRGGSRKLDPNSPYESTFSERWMLSINA